MRVYHLLPAKWGIEAIRSRRLKIARFSDLNDPFELIGAGLKDHSNRRAFQDWKDAVSEQYGLMCFTEGWNSPLMWSHYADRHYGFCLGFEVPDSKAKPVRYLRNRFRLDLSKLNEASIMKCLTSKYAGWSYEREIRLITDLAEKDPETGHYFMDMSDELALKEVIVGPLNNTTRKELSEKITLSGINLSRVKLTKARLAFKTYSVVRDRRGLR